jgi:hypothetical protein
VQEVEEGDAGHRGAPAETAAEAQDAATPRGHLVLAVGLAFGVQVGAFGASAIIWLLPLLKTRCRS